MQLVGNAHTHSGLCCGFDLSWEVGWTLYLKASLIPFLLVLDLEGVGFFIPAMPQISGLFPHPYLFVHDHLFL